MRFVALAVAMVATTHVTIASDVLYPTTVELANSLVNSSAAPYVGYGNIGNIVAVNGDTLAFSTSSYPGIWTLRKDSTTGAWGDDTKLPLIHTGSGPAIGVSPDGSDVMVLAKTPGHSDYRLYVIHHDGVSWAVSANGLMPVGYSTTTTSFATSMCTSDTRVAFSIRNDASMSYVMFIYGKTAGTQTWVHEKTIEYPGAASTELWADTCAFSGDGTNLFVAASWHDSGTSTNSGVVFRFNRDTGGAGQWGLLDTLVPNEPVADYDYFGDLIALHGQTLVVTARGRHGGIGSFHVFGQHVGGTDNWGHDQEVIFDNANEMYMQGQFGAAELALLNENTVVVSNRPNGVGEALDMLVFRRKDTGAFSGTGEYDQVLGVTDPASIPRPSPLRRFGSSACAVNGNELIVGAFASQTSEPGNRQHGALFSFVLPECTASKDCPSGKFCTEAQKCMSQACTTHYDCAGAFLPGRLPYCDKNGQCSDVFEGSCTGAAECNLAAARNYIAWNSIGQKRVRVVNTNTSLATFTSDKIMKAVRDSVGKPPLVTLVNGTSVASFNKQLFLDYDDDASLVAHIKTLLCGTIPCTISHAYDEVGGSRRALQTSGEITVTMTFDLDDVAYEELATRNSFNDPAFVEALALALGVSQADVVITTTNGIVDITFVVTHESDGEEPLDASILDDLNEAANLVDNATDVITSELGLDAGDIESVAVSLCGNRDCNGRGTCDSSTGICQCLVPNYWGVNCETPVSCKNGGRPENLEARCRCTFPYFGMRCASMNSACSCA